MNNSIIKLQNENISKWHRIPIYGIDFSGAQDAGKKIWIAEGVVKGDSLLIEDCFRARDLQDSGKDKDFMKENQDAAFGLDFPFLIANAFGKMQ